MRLTLRVLIVSLTALSAAEDDVASNLRSTKYWEELRVAAKLLSESRKRFSEILDKMADSGFNG